MPGDGGGEGRGERHGRALGSLAGRGVERAPPLVAVQDVDAPDRQPGAACQRLEHPDEAVEQRSRGGVVEQVAAVAQLQLRPLARVRDERERVVRGVLVLDLAHPQTGDGVGGAVVPRVVLDDDERVEELAVAGHALDVGQAEVLVVEQARPARPGRG